MLTEAETPSWTVVSRLLVVLSSCQVLKVFAQGNDLMSPQKHFHAYKCWDAILSSGLSLDICLAWNNKLQQTFEPCTEVTRTSWGNNAEKFILSRKKQMVAKSNRLQAASDTTTFIFLEINTSRLLLEKCAWLINVLMWCHSSQRLVIKETCWSAVRQKWSYHNAAAPHVLKAEHTAIWHPAERERVALWRGPDCWLL